MKILFDFLNGVDIFFCAKFYVVFLSHKSINEFLKYIVIN